MKLLRFLATLGLFGSGVLLFWVATLQIPDLNTFEERRVPESTKIYDRTGEVLLFDFHKDIQREIIPLEEISHFVKNATVAIEDARFYEHKGILPSAILRAILVNIGAFGYEQGGSTITQQVVKNSLLTQEKTIARKLKEWVLSLKLEQVASKEKILELYLNEIPYGGNIYGVQEASRVYFGKKAKDLSLAESAYLAALPQAPTYYSPYGNNKDKLDERKNLILNRMLGEQFITEEEHVVALEEDVVFAPHAEENIKAPHFVFFVREYLERKHGKDAIESSGLKVITTIDYELQKKAEEIVRDYSADNIEKFNAHNAGLIAVDPKTGHILVMVGSRDYFDVENEGNFNVTISPNRQPGSAFKPFVYATAFEKGFTPETVVFDLETQFDVSCDPEGNLNEDADEETDSCYTPTNYDDIWRGPVALRDALAQSINIPAIKTLYLAGLKDSLRTAQKMGITSLVDVNRYGLTLVLGGGEVSLLEMTSAYSVFANKGKRNPYTAIIQIEDKNGRILERFEKKEKEVIPEKIALQISDILSDNDARAPAFGERSYLYFRNRDVAAKTGTTNDYRDAWIIGYTPNISVGAWAGNNDNTSMEKKVAGFIIAPMWNAFMREALKVLPNESFKSVTKETNVSLQPILRGTWMGGESYKIDKISGKLATVFTPIETIEEKVIPDIHSILYWINKKDLMAGRPENPEDDSQFELWEFSVQKWVEEQGFDFENTEVPILEDDVHKPEYAPKLSVIGVNQDSEYSLNSKISLSVLSTGKYPLSKVDLFINNLYVGTSSNKPFTLSFYPKSIKSIRKENILSLVGYDAVKNKSTVNIRLKIFGI